MENSSSQLSIKNIYTKPKITDLELINIIGIRMENKSKTSGLIQYLNKNFPLEARDIDFIKRIKTIGSDTYCVLYPLLNIDDDTDENTNLQRWISNVFQSSDDELLTKENHVFKTILECSDHQQAEKILKLFKIPKYGPKLKYQWKEWNTQYWPLKTVNLYETELQLAKLDPKAELNVNSHDEKSVETCTKLVIDSFEKSKRVSGLFFNPQTKTIVKSSIHDELFLDESKNSFFSPYYSETEGTLSNLGKFKCSLRHCAVVGVDVIAQYCIETIEKLPPNTPSTEIPYLCKGLDLFISHEPCCMCAMALLHSRIRRIYFVHECGNNFGGLINKVNQEYCVHENSKLNHHFDVYQVSLN